MPVRKATLRQNSAIKRQRRKSVELKTCNVSQSALDSVKSYKEFSSVVKGQCDRKQKSLLWAQVKMRNNILRTSSSFSSSSFSRGSKGSRISVGRLPVRAVRKSARRTSVEKAEEQTEVRQEAVEQEEIAMAKPQQTAAVAIGCAIEGFDWSECLRNEEYARKCIFFIEKRYPFLMQRCASCPLEQAAATAAAAAQTTVSAPNLPMSKKTRAEITPKGVAAMIVSPADSQTVVAVATEQGVQVLPTPVAVPLETSVLKITADPSLEPVLASAPLATSAQQTEMLRISQQQAKVSKRMQEASKQLEEAAQSQTEIALREKIAAQEQRGEICKQELVKEKQTQVALRKEISFAKQVLNFNLAKQALMLKDHDETRAQFAKARIEYDKTKAELEKTRAEQAKTKEAVK